MLITGGAGFIGSNFILHWFKKNPNDQIINFDKLTYAGNLENLASIESNPNYKFTRGDIVDADEVNLAMHGVNVVVHFAAETHVDRSILGPAVFVETNVIGTQVLLNAALENKVEKFVHISTDEVFGSLELEGKEKFSEKTCYAPRSPYSASKAASDHLVRSYFHTYGLPVSIINSSNNYGPFQFPEKFIPLAITNLLENEKVPVYGDGKNVRDWLHVDDNCRAIEAVISKGKIGETYLVGGLLDRVTNLDVVEKIVNLLDKSMNEVVFVKDRLGHDKRYAVDWSKIKNELGWEPKLSFDEYLKKTVEWYKENKDWWKRVKAGNYMDYYKKQYGGRKDE